MDLKGRRQSSNVQTAQEAGVEMVNNRAKNSTKLRDPTSIKDQKIDPDSRVGMLEVGMDSNPPDFPFFKHTQKGTL